GERHPAGARTGRDLLWERVPARRRRRHRLLGPRPARRRVARAAHDGAGGPGGRHRRAARPLLPAVLVESGGDGRLLRALDPAAAGVPAGSGRFPAPRDRPAGRARRRSRLQPLRRRPGRPPGEPDIDLHAGLLRYLLLALALLWVLAALQGRRAAFLLAGVVFVLVASGFWIAALGRPYGLFVDPEITRREANMSVAVA